MLLLADYKNSHCAQPLILLRIDVFLRHCMASRSLSSLNIDYLGNHSQFIPVIAKWHQDEWHHISPDLSTQSRIKLYRSYKNSAAIPNCLLALINHKPVGSACLVASDMDTHTHMGPWLASVYVHEDYRCQGIASQLIEQCLQNAQQTGAKTLYLFTPDKTMFYQKRGWRLIESSLYHGEKVDIMSYCLNASSGR